MDVSGGASAGNHDTSASKKRAKGEKQGVPPDEVTAVSASSLAANQRAVVQMRRPAGPMALTPGELAHVPLPSGTAPRKKKPKQPKAHPEGATLASAESPALPASSTSTDSVAAVPAEANHSGAAEIFAPVMGASGQSAPIFMPQLQKPPQGKDKDKDKDKGKGKSKGRSKKAPLGSPGPPGNFFPGAPMAFVAGGTGVHADAGMLSGPAAAAARQQAVMHAMHGHMAFAQQQAAAVAQQHQAAHVKATILHRAMQTALMQTAYMRQTGNFQQQQQPQNNTAGMDPQTQADLLQWFEAREAQNLDVADKIRQYGNEQWRLRKGSGGMPPPAYPAPPWEASPELPPHIAAMIAAHGQNGDDHGPQERVSANRGGYNLRPSPAYTADPNQGQESTAASSSNRAAVHTGDGQPIYSGVLKTFSPKDGYGFIHCPTLSEGFDRDIYIHQAQVPEGASCGCTLSFCLYLNNRGQPQAREVSYVIGDDTEAGGMRGELLLDLSFEKLQQDNEAGCGRLTRTVRVASWNILAAAYATCKAFPDVEPGFLAWPRRRPMIASALATMDADVVCLQEVDRPFEDLGLQDYDHVRAQRPDARADGCIIAWKRSRFSLNRKEVISFDDYIPVNAERKERAQRFRRGNCAVIVELCSEGERPFAVATAHLCWEAEFEDVRQVQACVLLEAMEPHSKRLGQRTVLCGDLNAMPGCASHGIVTTLMSSVYADLEVAGGAVTNSNASASIPVVIDAEGSRKLSEERQFEESKRCGFAGMLDYICVDNRAANAVSRLRLPGREELRAKLGDAHGPGGPMPTLLCTNWPSDHLPVAADISFAINFQ